MVPRNHLAARFCSLRLGQFVLGAGELALFGDADLGRKRFFAGGSVGRAVEQAAKVADGGFQLVDGTRFFEGFCAAEVGGLLAFARVGLFAGEEVLAGGVDVVGAAFGGGHFGGGGEDVSSVVLLGLFLGSCIRKVVVVVRLDVANVVEDYWTFSEKTLKIRWKDRLGRSADLARIGQAGTLHSVSRFHACTR